MMKPAEHAPLRLCWVLLVALAATCSHAAEIRCAVGDGSASKGCRLVCEQRGFDVGYCDFGICACAVPTADEKKKASSDLELPVHEFDGSLWPVTEPSKELEPPVHEFDGSLWPVTEPSKEIEPPVHEFDGFVKQMPELSRELELAVHEFVKPVPEPSSELELPVHEFNGFVKTVTEPSKELEAPVHEFDGSLWPVTEPSKELEPPVHEFDTFAAVGTKLRKLEPTLSTDLELPQHEFEEFAPTPSNKNPEVTLSTELEPPVHEFDGFATETDKPTVLDIPVRQSDGFMPTLVKQKMKRTKIVLVGNDLASPVRELDLFLPIPNRYKTKMPVSKVMELIPERINYERFSDDVDEVSIKAKTPKNLRYITYVLRLVHKTIKSPAKTFRVTFL